MTNGIVWDNTASIWLKPPVITAQPFSSFKPTPPSLGQLSSPSAKQGMMSRLRDELLSRPDEKTVRKTILEFSSQRQKALDEVFEKSESEKRLEKQMERVRERREMDQLRQQRKQAQKEFFQKRNVSSQLQITGRAEEAAVNGDAGPVRVQREAQEAEAIVRQERWRRAYQPPESTREYEKLALLA